MKTYCIHYQAFVIIDAKNKKEALRIFETKDLNKSYEIEVTEIEEDEESEEE